MEAVSGIPYSAVPGTCGDAYGQAAAKNAALAPPASGPAAAGKDSVLLSPLALGEGAPVSAAPSTFTGGSLVTTLGSATIRYSNGGGIVWNGKTLNLRGLAGVDALRDDLAFQASGSFINVYNLATNTGYQLNSDGSQAKNPDGTVKTITGSYDGSQGVLILSNSGGNAGGTAGDVIINRASGATVGGGGGDDKIFNFAATATIKGGAGNAEIHTVGLGAGSAIDCSSAAGASITVRKGNMTGGVISLSGGINTLDAKTVSLAGVDIKDKAGADTTLTAKAMTGGKLELQGASASVVLTTLSTTGTVSFGGGENKLTAHTITGSTVSFGEGSSAVTATLVKNATLTNAGKADYTVKTFDGGVVDSSASEEEVAIAITSAAKGTTFKLGKGENTLAATGRTLTAVAITDAAAGAVTSITAGAIVADKAGARSTITLQGKESDGANKLVVSGAVSGATIDLGAGAGVLQAKTLTNASVSMDAASATGSAQTVTIAGNVNNSSITTGKGDDSVTIGGSVSNNSTLNLGAGKDTANIKGGVTKSDVDLGDGDNALTIGKSVNGFSYTGGAGKDDVHIKGAVSNAVIDLGAGTNAFKAQNDKLAGQSLSNVRIAAAGVDGVTNTIIAGAYKAGANKTISLGNGANDVAFSKGVSGLAYAGSTGADKLVIGGAVANSTFDLQSGDDSLEAVRYDKKGKAIGQRLNNVNITASGEGATTLLGGAVTTAKSGGNTIALGAGKNTVTLGGVSASAASKLTINGSAGSENAVTLGGAVKYTEYAGAAGKDAVNVYGAVSESAFTLGEGENSFSAMSAPKGPGIPPPPGGKGGRALTNVLITSDGASSTAIMGGAMKVTKAGKGIMLGSGANDITLNSVAGTKTVEAVVQTAAGGDALHDIGVLGSITNARITTGDGEGMLTAKWVGYSTITMGVNSAKAQTVGIRGDFGYSTLTTGAGKDNVSLNGSVVNSTVKLGDGANTFAANVLSTGKANKNLTYVGGAGDDQVSFQGSLSNSTINLGEGDNTLSMVYDRRGRTVFPALTDVNITASGDGKNSVTAGKVAVGKTGNSISLGSGTENSVSLASVAAKSTAQLTISGANSLTVAGPVKGLNLTGTDEDDTVTVNGPVSDSTFALGEGDNVFTATKTDKNGKVIGQTLSNVNITGSETNVITAGLVKPGQNGNIIEGTLNLIK